MEEVDFDSTYYTKTRFGILPASTCSALSSERTRLATQVNSPQGKLQTLSDGQRMPCNERLTSRRTPRFPPLPSVFDPRLPRSEGSRRRRWWLPRSSSTGRNRSFSVTKAIEVNAYPSCNTGDPGVRGWVSQITEWIGRWSLTVYCRGR